jgi:hypothetical protein
MPGKLSKEEDLLIRSCRNTHHKHDAIDAELTSEMGAPAAKPLQESPARGRCCIRYEWVTE